MEPQPLNRESPRGLSHELVLRLTELIQDGTIRRGEKLPTESAMMETYKVSRTVVREAMSQLQAAGLVETQQGRGSFVLNVPSQGQFAIDAPGVRTFDDVWDMLDFRLGVESEAAALAATRRTDQQLAELERLTRTFLECEARPSEAVEADFALHMAIARAAQNRHYIALLKSMGPMMIVMPKFRLLTGAQAHRTNNVRLAAVEHDSIVQAIARQEPETARAAIRLHLSNSRARLQG
ncbi:FadR family transcriptional regulator [Occultella glacieicola]|uniref:FadR family transcriptional regulator n=1 Tax=Occultella glacieicola TaxID=2518684 RepID=A0ABY2E7G9_9MICO|nr:FadR/GntR family transcriptional regulator [Occultella glacieicola]TDE96102.1 FadR family transcriptional regulator [Occultella glacieicola]